MASSIENGLAKARRFGVVRRTAGGVDEGGGGLGKPGLHGLDGLFDREWIGKGAPVRRDPKKGEEGGPGDPDLFAARKDLLDPAPGRRVEGARQIVGVDEEIRVEKDHRGAESRFSRSPSTSSKSRPGCARSALG